MNECVSVCSLLGVNFICSFLIGARTYAGASRTVVYASLMHGDTQFSYCRDKETGIIVEVTLIQGSTSATYKATSTNIWQASSPPPLTLPTISTETLSISISAAVAAAIITTTLQNTKKAKLMKKKSQTLSSFSTHSLVSS